MPATALPEYGPPPDPVMKCKRLMWFALDGTQPLFVFAASGRPGAA